MKSLLLNVATKIDLFTEYTGKLVSWLVMVLVILVGYDVSMRYLFRSGSIGLQEMEWHLFSILFLIGGAYTLKHDEHVRMDIFYRSRFLTAQQRAWLDVIGTLIILLPFCILIIISAWPFVTQAYLHNEGSPDPGGLPARWFIKTMIPMGFGLILIQGIAELIKKLLVALDSKQ